MIATALQYVSTAVLLSLAAYIVGRMCGAGWYKSKQEFETKIKDGKHG